MSSETTEKINLYYQDTRSDEMYQVQLDRVDGGYVVNFQFGQRGGTLQSGTKTPQPLSYENAAKVYNLLVAENIAKGYRESEDGTSCEDSAGHLI